ncbi:hypothetical protein [Acetobacter cerevisiae]|uniref:hypothetical protein n=1 Tax=Acetobacter cerevisiae TaxID=178900 RepID=UPI0020A20866|nr:hypothetical protein [Acetobacter cerevisiae]MCP1269624.1 hypothetical protein [Acetobacter cerevisiae]MCP1277578.1 hypothetical protein [Acetobacter cerevisiae]
MFFQKSPVLSADAGGAGLLFLILGAFKLRLSKIMEYQGVRNADIIPERCTRYPQAYPRRHPQILGISAESFRQKTVGDGNQVCASYSPRITKQVMWLREWLRSERHKHKLKNYTASRADLHAENGNNGGDPLSSPVMQKSMRG